MDNNDKSSKLIAQDCDNDKENESIPMDQVFYVYIFFACLHEALKHQHIEKMKKIEDNEEKHVPIQKPVSSERSAQIIETLSKEEENGNEEKQQIKSADSAKNTKEVEDNGVEIVYSHIQPKLEQFSPQHIPTAKACDQQSSEIDHGDGLVSSLLDSKTQDEAKEGKTLLRRALSLDSVFSPSAPIISKHKEVLDSNLLPNINVAHSAITLDDTCVRSEPIPSQKEIFDDSKVVCDSPPPPKPRRGRLSQEEPAVQIKLLHELIGHQNESLQSLHEEVSILRKHFYLQQDAKAVKAKQAMLAELVSQHRMKTMAHEVETQKQMIEQLQRDLSSANVIVYDQNKTIFEHQMKEEIRLQEKPLLRQLFIRFRMSRNTKEEQHTTPRHSMTKLERMVGYIRSFRSRVFRRRRRQ